MGVIDRARRPGALLGLATASVVANVVIVVTGGAVRLSNSGLGCPTWPRCGDGSLVPTRQYALHGVIEFSNRMLTVVLVVVAVATWLVAMLQQRARGPATLALLGIPAQAVLGGLTVLTHLNPWLVGLHFLLSMGLIAVTFVLRRRLTPAGSASTHRDRVACWLARATTAVALGVLVAGTVVTGAGPHAGDADSSGKVHRNGLSPASMAQLHADLVMILVGLSVGLLALLMAIGAAAAVRRAACVLVTVLAAQAAVGYAQYFLHVPPLLVGLHMLGACLVWLAVLRVQFLITGDAAGRTPVGAPGSDQPADRVHDQPDQRADHRAVDADELQVAPHL